MPKLDQMTVHETNTSSVWHTMYPSTYQHNCIVRDTYFVFVFFLLFFFLSLQHVFANRPILYSLYVGV